jgi:hypothetical protein
MYSTKPSQSLPTIVKYSQRFTSLMFIATGSKFPRSFDYAPKTNSVILVTCKLLWAGRDEHHGSYRWKYYDMFWQLQGRT